jgi:hypothetical protein
MLRDIDQNANRARESLAVEIAAASDETTTLQGINHLVHRGSRYPEVLLNVAFRGRDSEPREVAHDELEILALPYRRIAGTSWAARGLVTRRTGRMTLPVYRTTTRR